MGMIGAGGRGEDEEVLKARGEKTLVAACDFAPNPPNLEAERGGSCAPFGAADKTGIGTLGSGGMAAAGAGGAGPCIFSHDILMSQSRLLLSDIDPLLGI
jgi:hypothetical protein